MNHTLGLKVSLLLLVAVPPQLAIPSVLFGTWKVGRGYDGGPTDLNQKQSLRIEKLRLEFRPDVLKVCGRDIAIKNVTISVMTQDEFLSRYRRMPNSIGLNGQKITELEINSYELTHACGEFSDPGTHVMFDENNHFDIEVDNLYYPLKRLK